MPGHRSRRDHAMKRAKRMTPDLAEAMRGQTERSKMVASNPRKTFRWSDATANQLRREIHRKILADRCIAKYGEHSWVDLPAGFLVDGKPAKVCRNCYIIAEAQENPDERDSEGIQTVLHSEEEGGEQKDGNMGGDSI